MGVGVALLVGSFAASGCAGCVSAEDRYNEFSERIIDATIADSRGGVLADISGEQLFVLTTSISPPQPIFLIGSVTNYSELAGSGSADFSFQPLTVADKTETGDPLIATGVTIGSDGAFTIPFRDVTVPADANPITGQPIAADLEVIGVIVNTDIYCGDVDGEANMLPLFGSTFAATRIVPGARGADLPIDTAPGACP